jgi:6-pyruvoyltetrahydropterin/6-carboxytetrahydropterin synthase
MRIAKEFTWEMGHRLPEHFGKCKNIHGHSYKMIVELEGSVEDNGMVMDYFDLKKIVIPMIEEVDHSFMVYQEDKEVISFLKKMNSKMVVVEFQSTVENICSYFMNKINKIDFPPNIKFIKVRIYETSDDYAENTTEINKS